MFDLKIFRDKNRFSQKDAALYFGCTQPFISDIERGKEKIPDKYISKVQADKNLVWNFPEEKKEGITNTNGIGIPYYNIDVTATLTESFSDIAEEPEFYVDFKPFNDCTAYFTVFGDSMYPMITHGEIIAVKKVDNPEYIQYGEAYLVVTNAETNNMRTIKLIRKHEKEDMIILRPANPNFDEMVIPRHTILKLYIIKGKITRKLF
jgi:signal peptidase I